MRKSRSTAAVALPRQYPIPPRLPQRSAELLEAMLKGFYALRAGRRRFKRETVTADITVICDLVKHAAKVPGQLTHDDFNAWALMLAEVRGISVSTQRKYYSTIRVFCEYVIGNQNLRNRIRQTFGCDPIQLVTPETGIPHVVLNEGAEDSNRRAFLHREIERFFGGIDLAIRFQTSAGTTKTLVPLLRDKALFSLLYVAGLRIGEVSGLNLDSFEPNPAFPELGDFGFVRVFGKGSKWRIVPIMVPEVARLLATYLAGVRPRLAAIRGTDANEPAMFLSERGQRLTSSGIRARFNYLLLETGMLATRHVPHNMRASSVTHAALSGLDLESIREMAGHVYQATTQGYMYIPNGFVAEDFSAAIRRNLDRAQA